MFLSGPLLVPVAPPLEAVLVELFNLGGIEPTAHAIPLATPLRPDQAVAGMDPELAIANAPSRTGTAFSVPKVLEGEER